MKNMTLKNIAKACGGKLFGGREDLEIAGAVMDSREIEKDFLFFAIKGAGGRTSVYSAGVGKRGGMRSL